jgi:hypothetical protein
MRAIMTDAQVTAARGAADTLRLQAVQHCAACGYGPRQTRAFVAGAMVERYRSPDNYPAHSWKAFQAYVRAGHAWSAALATI